jgi:hypothetical protein
MNATNFTGNTPSPTISNTPSPASVPPSVSTVAPHATDPTLAPVATPVVTPIPAVNTFAPIASTESPAPTQTTLITPNPTVVIKTAIPAPTETSQSPVLTAATTLVPSPNPVITQPPQVPTLPPTTNPPTVQTLAPIVPPATTHTPSTQVPQETRITIPPTSVPLAVPTETPLPKQTLLPTQTPLPKQTLVPTQTPLPTSVYNPVASVQPDTSAPSLIPTSTPSTYFPLAPSPSGQSDINKGLVVAGITGGVVLIIGLICGLVVLLRRHGRRSVPRSVTNYQRRVDSADLGLPTFSALFTARSGNIQMTSSSAYGPEPFTIGDLQAATDDFSADKVLGEGAFGKVFKGVHKGKDIAIKQMRLNLGGSADREFRAELEVISRVHHRNLVKLMGFVVDGDQRYLIMEYVPNGTLYSALHPKLKFEPLSWEQRKKAVVGVARGLAYLHEDCFPRIIHRDLKSSNILLDSKFEAQVADFGLAKLDEFSASHTHVSTRVMGTFGYLDPAYATTGRLTEESDVYSFGVVLFELVSGRKAVDLTKPFGKQSLVEWARPLVEKKMTYQLADDLLDDDYDEDALGMVLELAHACTDPLPNNRPRMKDVLSMLLDNKKPDQPAPGLDTVQEEEVLDEMSDDFTARIGRLAPGAQTVLDPEIFKTGR